MNWHGNSATTAKGPFFSPEAATDGGVRTRWVGSPQSPSVWYCCRWVRPALGDRSAGPRYHNRQNRYSSAKQALPDPPAASLMIHVHNLTKHYADVEHGKFVALGGVSFDATTGQIFGLLGPNGAGKTTVLRILSTVLRPTTGRATVAGFDCVTQSSQVRHQHRLHVGQHRRLRPHDRLGNGRIFRPPLRHRERAARASGWKPSSRGCEMNDIRDVLGAKMSTGMRQKVSIARSIVHDPPVLIFDEATSGLDVLVARALLNTVAELRDQGKCIVFSTHIMREAEKLCDRIAIMHRGSHPGRRNARRTLRPLSRARSGRTLLPPDPRTRPAG